MILSLMYIQIAETLIILFSLWQIQKTKYTISITNTTTNHCQNLFHSLFNFTANEWMIHQLAQIYRKHSNTFENFAHIWCASINSSHREIFMIDKLKNQRVLSTTFQQISSKIQLIAVIYQNVEISWGVLWNVASYFPPKTVGKK